MQNISAVLDKLGEVYIKGYKPARNVGPRAEGEIKSLLVQLRAQPQQTNEPLRQDNFEAQVRQIRRQRVIPTPKGIRQPTQKMVETTSYYRDANIKAWVRENANGVCEACQSPAPFVNNYNEPFLEVHHMKPLAQGGSDTIANAVALCPKLSPPLSSQPGTSAIHPTHLRYSQPTDSRIDF